MQSKLAKDLRARRQGKYYGDSVKLKCIIMEDMRVTWIFRLTYLQ